MNAQWQFTRGFRWQLPMVRALGVAAVVSAGVLTIIASNGGGGDGGCVDLYPNPDYDFMVYKGLDSADMNGDGLDDLVVSSSLLFGSEPASQQCGGITRSEGSVSVFLQDFSNPGGFLAPQRYASDTGNPNALKLADLNGDALPDVIVTNRWNSNVFQILLHDPMNVGQLGDAVAYGTVTEPHQIGVGDIDLDGRPDVVIAGTDTVAWHRQQAGGSFDGRNAIGPGDSALAVADFDADGLLEVATAGRIPDDEEVLVYRQSMNLPVSFSLAQGIAIDAGIWSLGGGDLNEDGRPDIAAAGFHTDGSSISETWYRVLQTPATPLEFSLRLPGLGASNNLTAAPMIADLNGDQREDVVIGGGDGEVSVFLQGQTPGEFGQKTVYQLPPDAFGGPDPVNAMAVADLNGDVLPDIAVSHGEVFVLFQQPGSPGTFGTPVRIAGEEL